MMQATAPIEARCTLLICPDDAKNAHTEVASIIKTLEEGSDEEKRGAVKTSILLLLQGEQIDGLLMTIIRYCINTSDHELRKLLHLYWEVVEKKDQDGNMVEEMLLVCNAIRNELQHHNEYVRGCALRFLCKMNMPEILEPLAPSVKDNLSHPNIYVRRNAVLCLYCMYLNFGDSMVPDAPELIERFLVDESDTGARRNAFLALFNIAPEKAVDFLTDHFEEVDRFGEGFQLTVLEVARRACRADAQQKSRFVRVIFQLLNCDSAAVVYESATTLMSLSSAPTAVRAAAQALVTLLTSQSDINVKLIVLERLSALKKHHTKLLQELVMDLLRALACPEPDIQAKVVEIAMDLVSPRNIDAVMAVLKKEVVRTSNDGAASNSMGGQGSASSESASEYRTIIIKAIHACCIKFPEVASSVVHLLLDFITQPGAEVVVMLVREVVEAYPALRPAVLEKLQDSLEELPSARVASMVVWILGEYCDTTELGFEAFTAISQSVGSIPITTYSAARAAPATEAVEETPAAGSSGPVILPDGTYASQSAVTEEAPPASVAMDADSTPFLRRMLLTGQCQLSASVGNALTKIALRRFRESGDEASGAKALAVDVLIILTGLIEAGKSSYVEHPNHPDCNERLEQCICILLDPSVRRVLSPAWLTSCRENFEKLLAGHRSLRDSKESKEEVPTVMPDRLITFRQLRARGQMGAAEIDLEDDYDIERATGMAPGSDFANRLRRVHQLTGLSDPVYAEAIITVHDYDIALELFIDNRTDEVLTNLAVELATMGDLKLVERPQNFTIGPRESKRICASIKVSSTETGHVFGSIVYDSVSAGERVVINMNDIHIDIMDYIAPATCSGTEFRSMWAEFEWENKVAVNTNITDVHHFLRHIQAATNMNCLTPAEELQKQENFLAANLYARSVFGEDALVNLSVEKQADGKVGGYIRIRSKTQGIALSLGDRITAKQKIEQDRVLEE